VTVSIVIPCYNAARFVAEAVASACAQTWADTEVIVVDDGSTDGSGEVAARWPQARIVQQRNAGLARARNAGAAASRGGILIFLDADDRLRPGAAAAAVRAFDQHPDAAMVFGRCQLVSEDGAPLPTPLPRVSGDYYAELLRHNYIWMPAMAALRRAPFIEIGGFDARVNPSADYDLYLRLASRYPIASHDETTADYRQHAASMSTDPALMLRTTLAVLDGQRTAAARAPRLTAIRAEGIRHWRWFYGERLVERFRLALREGHLLTAVHYAWTLLRLYPEGVRHHLRRKAALLRGAVSWSHSVVGRRSRTP
jgi:glycosyltransferase involved in cell wall biosynthesis